MIELGQGQDVDDLTTRTRQGGGDGVGTSDELLDSGRRGLRFFERFLPRYEAWTGRTLGGGMSGITTTYDEVGGIRFDRLRADADRLGQVHTELTDHHTQLTNTVATLPELWQGDAATTADDYGSRFLNKGATVADGVDVARTLIGMGTDRAETAVMTRAKLVAGLDSHHVGGLTPRQVDQVIAAARGHAQPPQLFEMVMLAAFSPLDTVPAANDEQGFMGMLDQASAWMGQRGTQWMDSVFVPTVDAAYQAFQQYTQTTTQDVGDSWTGVTDGVGALDPQGTPVTTDPASAVTTPVTTPVSAPGSAAPTPSTSTAPTAVTMPAPVDSPVQTTSPASTLPSIPPVSADPIGASVVGDQQADGAGDAQLAHAPDSADTGQTGRVGDGLTLTKPDADGHSTLTVQRPDGSTADYSLDLGGNGMPGGSQDGQNVQAGVDGTATIHDGSMTITVHRPATDGPVTVTVDDGTGAPPQNYTVDFSGGANPSGAGDPVLAGPDPSSLAGQASAPGASMAVGGHGSSATSADGSIGGSIGGVGGGGGGIGIGGGHPGAEAPAAKPAPGAYTGVGEATQLPAAAAGGGGAAGAVAAGAAGAGGMGMGMMPMMGGMGGGAGRDSERQSGRLNPTEDFFSDDMSSYKRIREMLEPELPGD